MKVGKPEFFFGRHEDDAHTWVFRFNLLLAGDPTAAGHTQSQNILIAASYLRGNAATWFQRVHLEDSQLQQPVEQPQLPNRINSWQLFTAALISNFSSVDRAKVARDKMASLRQRKDVESYSYAFNKCVNNIPDLNAAEALYAYIRGLKGNVRVQLELNRPPDLATAQQRAAVIDNILYSSQPEPQRRSSGAGGGYGRRNGYSGGDSQGSSGGHDGPTPMEINNVRSSSHNRSGGGHNRGGSNGRDSNGRYVRLDPNEKARLYDKGNCYYCRKPGHIAINCPNKGKARPAPGNRVSFANIVKTAMDEASREAEN